MIEILLVAAFLAIVAALAVPQASQALDRSKTWAAARYLSARMAMARSYAVARAAHVALRFREEHADVTFQMFVDGNRNGVRTLDIAASVDRALDQPVRLSDLFPGVAIGIANDELGSDPVRFGVSDLVSFTPLGTATPGTVYVRGPDGLQLAVRVVGATGRTRLLRYLPRTRQWVDSF